MTDTATPVLQTELLSKSFGGLAAVRDVSIALRRGELHALIGPNGAGKSTLVNLLSGELKPTSGTITLGGRAVTGASTPQMAQAGVARSFQRTNIFSALTIRENVRLAAQAIHTPTRHLLRPSAAARDLDARVATNLERFGLHEAPHRIAGTLSHGEQRLLEISMTLAGDPRVLLLDEPLAGMGNEESDKISHLLKDLARDHAVLLIEHDMDFVFAVADCMTVMVEGSLLASGPPDAIRADPAVQRAYLGAVQ
ncbi:MAG: ABC transporter ATP-binding protein [Hyphomicrobiaceae bacterium]